MPADQLPKTSSTVAADVPEPEIDALFVDDVADDGPGAAVGIYHHGRLVFAKSYGLADLESGQPITAQTRFHAASVSKQFTAFAIALLAREGKVDLDADVRDYLPYVPDFGVTITVRHLILHTSGLRNQIMLLLLGGQSVEGRATQQQIVNLVSRQEALNFAPGSDCAYSNTGYILLAEIVFAVTGQTLREFTTERIFTPLGMEDTFFFDDVTEIVPGRAHSYTRRRDEDGQETGGWARALLNFDNVGSSSLFTTVEDLVRWAGNLVDSVVGDRALIEQVCTSGALDDGTSIKYAFGLEHGEINGHTVLSHTGSDAAFRSVFAHFPEHNLAVTTLANTELGLMGKVGSIADLYLPNVQSAPTTPEEDSTADLSRFAGTYVPEHDISCRLEVCDGSLFHCWGSRRPQKLTARTDGTLDFGSPSGQSFVPVLDISGEVTGLEVPREGFGPPLLMQRVAIPEDRIVDLAEFAGDYRSQELDITYTVNAEDDVLVVGHLWSNRPTAKLSRVLPDRFEFSGDRVMLQLKRILVFQRDAEGRICGLLLHTAGDRNIRFDRVGDAHPPIPVASKRAQGTWG